MLDVRWVQAAEDVAAALAVRRAVFVDEQGISPERESDREDQVAEHFLARLDGVPVGAGRLVEEPGGIAHLGRLAVLAPARGRAVGAALVAAIEDRARRRGLGTVLLAAQVTALPFYERLGYTAFGEQFLDAGLPHRHMSKRLAEQPRSTRERRRP